MTTFAIWRCCPSSSARPRHNTAVFTSTCLLLWLLWLVSQALRLTAGNWSLWYLPLTTLTAIEIVLYWLRSRCFGVLSSDIAARDCAGRLTTDSDSVYCKVVTVGLSLVLKDFLSSLKMRAVPVRGFVNVHSRCANMRRWWILDWRVDEMLYGLRGHLLRRRRSAAIRFVFRPGVVTCNFVSSAFNELNTDLWLIWQERAYFVDGRTLMIWQYCSADSIEIRLATWKNRTWENVVLILQRADQLPF